MSASACVGFIVPVPVSKPLLYCALALLTPMA